MNKDEALNKFTFMMEYRNLSSNTIHMYEYNGWASPSNTVK